MEDDAFEDAANMASSSIESDVVPTLLQHEQLLKNNEGESITPCFGLNKPLSDDPSKFDNETSKRLNAKILNEIGIRNNSLPRSSIHSQDEIGMFNREASNDMILNALDTDDLEIIEENTDYNEKPNVDNTLGSGLEEQMVFGSDGTSSDEHLAIAVEVSSEETEVSIPQAIEHHPKSKPSSQPNHRFRIYMVGFMVSVLMIGIGMIVFLITSRKRVSLTKSQNHFQNIPTISPTWPEEKSKIIQNIIDVVGQTSLTVEGSPHALAADWLLNTDPLQLSHDAETLIQRYLLALFYFSTSQRAPWKSCNPSNSNETMECSYATLIYAFPEIQYELETKIRWLSEKHECFWAGVVCDDYQVRAIELTGQDIVGTLPSELAMLSSIQSITLAWNDFYGTVPSEMFRMQQLVNLELQYNFFTGQVLSTEPYTTNLERLVLTGNMLSGNIAACVKLPNLKGLYVQDNNLSGTIPNEIENARFLSFLRMEQNFLKGTIPSEIGNLANLKELWLFRNTFTGTLPRELGNLSSLMDQRLHFNAFHGSIPEEHYTLPQLRRWDIQNCNFTGTISTAIGQLSTLWTYRIRSNNFYGIIPSEMGNLQYLSTAWLHNNNITGTVPQEVCSLRTFGKLSYLQVDCDKLTDDGSALVECICCESSKGTCE